MNKSYKIDCILLIDDDEITNFLNKEVISNMGISDSIEVTSEVEAALTFIKSCYLDDCEPKTLLIFLDINMPIWDGFEFLDQLNLSTELSFPRIDIIILTTSLNKLDRERAKKYQILDYVVKPLTQEKVRAVLDKRNKISR